jgi:hypothetical protein
VHEEEVDVAGVVNEESLVAGGHHVACLLVGSETNLSRHNQLLSFAIVFPRYQISIVLPQSRSCIPHTDGITI